MSENKLTVKHLSEALENNEFLFFYQPILSLKTGKINASEALIRWQKDNGDLLPPGDFIPYAEQSGFIREITKAMIPRFLEDQKKILQIDSTIISSINVSAKDIADEEFVTMLMSYINDYDIPPNNIKIELTESSALALTSKSLLQIAELKANNIGLSVDDFGTGFATFEKLKNLPFNTLKIDYMITNGAMATPDGLTLLDHSINLAHQLEMNSVAEGVENENLMRYLMGIGCDHVQGYYVSKPLELSSFIEFISKKRVWDIANHGQIYKIIIDYMDWVRKVYSTLCMENGNVRIVPHDPDESTAGTFLNKVIESTDIGLYYDLHIAHKKSYEVAKILLNAKSSRDHDLVEKLLPDFFDASSIVMASLQEAYSRECLHGLLKKSSFFEN